MSIKDIESTLKDIFKFSNNLNTKLLLVFRFNVTSLSNGHA